MMTNVYPVKTLSHLRPFLIGFRKSRGLTQRAVAEQLGVSQQTYARLEANPASVSFTRLFRVFTVLGVELTLSSEPCYTRISHSKTKSDFKNSPARKEKW